MGMFIVERGTEAKVIKVGKDWYAKNFQNHITKETNVFGKEEMIIDPAGINKTCPPLKGITIGSAYADAGNYGFKREGWIILVHASKVVYG